MVLEVLVVARDARQIRLVEQRALQLVEVTALDVPRSAPPPLGREEPELVANDRTAERAAVVVRMPDGDVGIQPARAQVVIQVAALQLRTRVRHAQASGELIAAILLDDVDLNAAAHRFGGHAARLDDDLLERLRIEAEDAERLLVLVHAVDVRAEVRAPLAVHAELAAFTLVAADVLERRVGVGRAGNNRRVLADALRGRNRIERLARDGRLLPHVLDIDHRCFA